MIWIRIRIEYLHLTGTFTKLSPLNVKLLFSVPLYILVLYILRNIEKSLFITSVTKVHGLDNHQ